MTSEADRGSPDARDQAADWVARLSNDGVGEADWLAFKAWLDADGAAGEAAVRRRAFDAAQSLWLEYDQVATRPPAPMIARPRRGRRLSRPKGVAIALACAVAAAACAVFIVFTQRPAQSPVAEPPAAVTYATAVGEHRQVRLADGARIELDGASLLSVAYSATERRVRLDRGEAAFDVVHDTHRPFFVDAGAGQVRVLGTAFDVARSDQGVQVAVARGVVSFTAGGRSLRLPRGHAAAAEGGAIRLAAVDPAAVGSWKQGWRVYRDQSLAQVVEDLNRKFAHPLRLGDTRAAQMTFTGTLVIDTEPETVRRLTVLLPIRAHEANGATVLNSR